MDDTTVIAEQQPQPTSIPPKLSDVDKLSIDLTKERMESAKTRAEFAELQYRYLILRLYYQYGLTANDIISTDGDIVIGGKNQQVKQ